MSDTLAQHIAKAQANLGDDGTIFTTALLTAAFRRALQEFNRRAPVHVAITITGVNDQYEYNLTTTAATAVQVLNVLQDDEPVTYDEHLNDASIIIRLRSPINTTESLTVWYAANHTINGLDSATVSTLPARDDQILVDGGCFYAIMTRAASRVETINLSKDQSDNYREIAGHFQTAFNLGVANLARRKLAPVGEPDTRAWNDGYHSWGQ